MSVLFFWMEFNYYYSIYYFGSFYRPINTHICIINIDITLMFYNVQYVKATSVRSHPLPLVSNISCSFNVKKFAAQACLLPWFQKRNGGKRSALALMCWAGWVRLFSSNSCMCHLISPILSVSPSNHFLISSVRIGRYLRLSLEVYFYRAQRNRAQISLITHLMMLIHGLVWEQWSVHVRGSNTTHRHMKDERWEQRDFVTSLL